MNTRDQFGSYLLLKKLGEDALGETFRAGKVGRSGLERVLLLRVFNGQGLDGGRLGEHLEAQGPLAQALRSPNLGACVDLGQVGRVPFVAYDYISGRHLGALIDQARKRQSPVSFDHALLIAERTAMGLAVAHETRYQGGRVLHGFLVPQLIMVSNEGETRLLGFEAAGGLRGSAAHPLLKDAFARYLPPETLAGQPAHKADDVYSLGVLLYELVTGERFAMPPQGPGALLAQATLAVEGTPLPAPVADLLRQSLAPRDQRLADVTAWHKAISALMADGHYNPTTFNLAFYMHSLFRDEIDRESQEIEAEKTIRVSAEEMRVAAAPAPAPAPAVAPAPSRSLEEEYGLPGEAAAKKPLPIPLIGGAAAAVVLLALGGWFLFGRGGGEPAPAAPPVAEEASAATGMTPEKIQELLDQALEQQRVQMQEGLKAASDKQAEEIRALQKQLEDAQRARTTGTATTGAPAAAVPVAVPAVATPAVATPTAVAAATPAAVAAPPTPAPQATAPPVQAAVTPIPVAAAPVRPAAAARMKVGDLIPGPGPGVTPPRVTRRANLRYPPAARRMNREATVTVRVLVDETGRVVEAEVPEKAGLGFDEAAIEAARGTGYSPATKDGVAGTMWTELKIVFTLG
ncbi:MAG TPA: TonB family protein, partial [Thermoanaerobaculia bacterium]|nr:TonB family protein [Thermoanaerobaculia bacterium]